MIHLVVRAADLISRVHVVNNGFKFADHNVIKRTVGVEAWVDTNTENIDYLCFI